MWLGAAAGLALLTLSILARPTNALVASIDNDNQVLTYDGAGWGSARGPQVCSAVSLTMHTTSTTGNFLTLNFTGNVPSFAPLPILTAASGNAISVLGPQTSLSSPMTAILDGTVQRVLPVTQDAAGCGVLYSISNIPNELHTLVLIYHAQSGSVNFSVSGIR